MLRYDLLHPGVAAQVAGLGLFAGDALQRVPGQRAVDDVAEQHVGQRLVRLAEHVPPRPRLRAGGEELETELADARDRLAPVLAPDVDVSAATGIGSPAPAPPRPAAGLGGSEALPPESGPPPRHLPTRRDADRRQRCGESRVVGLHGSW
jgi:hypothetical protein